MLVFIYTISAFFLFGDYFCFTLEHGEIKMVPVSSASWILKLK